MPTYEFVNETTKEQIKMFITLAERDKFLLENPHMKQTLCNPGYADSVRLGIRKIDSGFNDVLTKAKKSHWGSNINNR